MKQYLGRLIKLWGICAGKFTWDEATYDMYVQACAALTNIHIQLNPLEDSDNFWHSNYLKMIRSIGEQIIKAKREIEEQSRARCDARTFRSFILKYHESNLRQFNTP